MERNLLVREVGRLLPEIPLNFELNPFGENGGGRIVNKKDPVKEDLVFIDYDWKGSKTKIEVHWRAKEAFEKMIVEARKEGIPHPLLMPTSGYRSSYRQKELWTEALIKYDNDPDKARKWVAPPGSSAHQSGRALDLRLDLKIKNNSENAKNGTLRKTNAYKWLSENAHRFGFYPYSAEPWHWEFNPPVSLSLSSTTGSIINGRWDTLRQTAKQLALGVVESLAKNPIRKETINNRKFAIQLGWNQYIDRINDLLLPYSGQSGVSLGEEAFADALKKWQRSQGLQADGVLGPKTWEMLRKYF